VVPGLSGLPGLRVMLVTRHEPLREAIAGLTAESVLVHLELLDHTLRRMGCSAPRIALAGLNPHAGEGGLFGSEEGDLLAPTVDRARSAGLDVEGPVSPDAVFAQAMDGSFDGVLALYHDQAFIPIKLLGRDTAVTLLAGFPYLRLSPTHGTAYDIAGSGRASAENLTSALLRAAEWGPGWVRSDRGGVPGP
jgi:4-hydroxythreonine-4-phosphate dehydrogenase